MTEIREAPEERARELLAIEYDRDYPTYASLARVGRGDFTLCSIRAITAALKAPAEPVLQPNTIAAGQREAIEQIITAALVSAENERRAWGIADRESIVTASTAAILAIQSQDAVVDERERCAKIADEHRRQMTPGTVQEAYCASIASAIRDGVRS